MDFARLTNRLPATFRATALLRAFGIMSVPLLASIRPTVTEISDELVQLRVPLNRWTRNHLKSMYFGTIAMGADCVVGLLAVHHIRKRKAKVQLSFKDFQANFLKRPESDVLFVCTEGAMISQFVDDVITSGERRNLSVPAYAVLAKNPAERVCEFTLTLSLKKGK
jgi:acyl-coenzyme A thioesterase PaaI-like protein